MAQTGVAESEGLCRQARAIDLQARNVPLDMLV